MNKLLITTMVMTTVWSVVASLVANAVSSLTATRLMYRPDTAHQVPSPYIFSIVYGTIVLIASALTYLLAKRTSNAPHLGYVLAVAIYSVITTIIAGNILSPYKHTLYADAPHSLYSILAVMAPSFYAILAAGVVAMHL